MIEREKVIKTLTDALTAKENYPWARAEMSFEFIEMLLELLKEQEAVVQKTGHWIWLQFCANEGVYCSECHTKMFDRYPMKKKLSKFCGHCGAKMDDEVEGS